MAFTSRSGFGGGRRRGLRPRLSQAACRAEALEPRTLLAFSPVAPQFRVNSDIRETQTYPAAASDGDGDVVVVWMDNRDNSFAVYGQRYAPSGAPAGLEFKVAAPPTIFEIDVYPSVASDPDGDFVVTWNRRNFAGTTAQATVMARRYSAAGAPAGPEFAVSPPSAYHFTRGRVAMDARGNFVVAWVNDGGDGSSLGIFARRFDAAGNPLGDEFRVNTTTAGIQQEASVACDARGNFVVTWQGPDAATGTDEIFAQRYSAAGAPLGGEFRVNTYTTATQADPVVAADADGDFVVAWVSSGQDGSREGVYAQRFGAAGAPAGGEFLVNTFTSDTQNWPSVTMDVDGDFTVAWESYFAHRGTWARRYDAAGVPQSGEIPVAATANDFDKYPVVASDADGELLVAWAVHDGSNDGIFARRFADDPDDAGPVVSDVSAFGRPAAPGARLPRTVTQIDLNFSERLSVAGGAAGAGSVVNPANWRLTRDGQDVSPLIQSVAFGFDAAANKFKATVSFTPLAATGSYVLTARESIRDPAGNALDGNLDGHPGGDFAFPFSLLNTAPASYGIAPVPVLEDEDDTVLSLWDAFADAEDPDDALTYALTDNTNPSLFGAVRLDAAGGTLTLDYAPDANGRATLTVRATDRGGLSASATFSVTVGAVNDAPAVHVPREQVVAPNGTLVFSTANGNAISVTDPDGAEGGAAAEEEVVIRTEPPTELQPGRTTGVTVKSEPGRLTLTGPLPALNAALDGLRLVAPRGAEGRIVLDVTADDRGNSGAGGPMADTARVDVRVDLSAVPVFAVTDASVTEGNAGTAALTFHVTLLPSAARAGAASVDYSTLDGTAAAGSDYQNASGTLTFAPGETSKAVSVIVNGDTTFEPDETFSLRLSNAVGADIADRDGLGTITNDDPVPPPVVTQVFVSAAAWAPGFKSFLASRGLGDAAYGYAVPAGAGQLAGLPWVGLNQVSVRFDQPVLVLDPDLAVYGVNVAGYAVAGFDYDEASYTATWTLGAAPGTDKLLLDLDGGAGGVVSTAAAALDGDWANGADAFPSGDGTAGGDLRFRVNVLAGDVNGDGRADALDWFNLLRRRHRTAANPGTGPLQYTPFYDVNGDGAVGIPDLLAVRRNLLARLPAAEPTLPTPPAGAPSSVTRDLFSEGAIL